MAQRGGITRVHDWKMRRQKQKEDIKTWLSKIWYNILKYNYFVILTYSSDFLFLTNFVIQFSTVTNKIFEELSNFSVKSYISLHKIYFKIFVIRQNAQCSSKENEHEQPTYNIFFL